MSPILIFSGRYFVELVLILYMCDRIFYWNHLYLKISFWGEFFKIINWIFSIVIELFKLFYVQRCSNLSFHRIDPFCLSCKNMRYIVVCRIPLLFFLCPVGSVVIFFLSFLVLEFCIVSLFFGGFARGLLPLSCPFG